MRSKIPVFESLTHRSDILKRFWNVDVADTEKYELYFRYYDGVCRRLSTSSELSAMCADTHEDLFHIMDILWKVENVQALKRQGLREALRQFAPASPAQLTNPDLRMHSQDHLPRSVDDSRDDSFTEQQTRTHSDEKLNNTINLVLRLWLTIDIRARQFGGVGDVQWNDESSLGDLINQKFPTAKKGTDEVQRRDVLLDEQFTAPNLFRRRGIKTEFTEKLSNHLIYDAKAQTLMVYPLRHFLNLHKTW